MGEVHSIFTLPEMEDSFEDAWLLFKPFAGIDVEGYYYQIRQESTKYRQSIGYANIEIKWDPNRIPYRNIVDLERITASQFESFVLFGVPVLTDFINRRRIPE